MFLSVWEQVRDQIKISYHTQRKKGTKSVRCTLPTLSLIWESVRDTLSENSDDTTRWTMLPQHFVKPLGQCSKLVKPCWGLPRISNGTNSPRLTLLYRQHFWRVQVIIYNNFKRFTKLWSSDLIPDEYNNGNPVGQVSGQESTNVEQITWLPIDVISNCFVSKTIHGNYFLVISALW